MSRQPQMPGSSSAIVQGRAATRSSSWSRLWEGSPAVSFPTIGTSFKTSRPHKKRDDTVEENANQLHNRPCLWRAPSWFRACSLWLHTPKSLGPPLGECQWTPWHRTQRPQRSTSRNPCCYGLPHPPPIPQGQHGLLALPGSSQQGWHHLEVPPGS